MVPSGRSSLDLSEYTLFKMKNIYFFIYETYFVGDIWKILGFLLHFLLKLLPKFSEFIHSDDCIGNITSKPFRLYPVFIQKRFEFNKTNDYI